MAHFAKVLSGLVVRVIVADAEFVERLVDHEPGEWIQTSYNTYGGVHLTGGEPLRKNFAAVGYTYDRGRDAFIPPQPYPSWSLNEETCLWEPPTPVPEGEGPYEWDEPGQEWREVPLPKA